MLNLNLEEAKKLAEKYKKEIEYHNKKYYEEDSPEMILNTICFLEIWKT